VAAAVVILGDGDPGIDVELTARAGDPQALREVLAGLAGDVVLLDPELRCSGPYPVADVFVPGSSRVLVGAGGSAPVRIASGVVVCAGTSVVPLAAADDRAAGMLHVAAADRPALDAALTALPQGPAGKLWEQLLSLLVMQAVVVKPVVAAPFEIGASVQPAEDPVRLQARRCARGGDGWVSERTVRRLSRLVTPTAVRLGLAPTTVTVLSLLVGAAAVGAALLGTRWGYLLTAVLMVVSLVLDCVDGEVARWTHRYSKGGAWLDAVGDRVKEYAVWFAVGWAVESEVVWRLILACLVLFTTKHFLDYGWSLRFPPWRPTAVPFTSDPDPWTAAGAAPPTVRAPSWRRILGMPIAERWLLLAVLLPVVGPLLTFWALAVLGALSLGYTVATRVRWSHAAIHGTEAEVQAITDPGPLLLALRPDRVGLAFAALIGWLVAMAGVRWWPLAFLVALGLFALAYGRGPRGRFGWMSPAVARFTEMTLLLAVAWPMIGPAAYALLAASAWRHYDVIYRIRNQGVLPDRFGWVLMLGTEGRVLVGAGLTVVGVATWYWFALYLALIAVADSLLSWFGRRA
jgi:hypothetical protein